MFTFGDKQFINNCLLFHALQGKDEEKQAHMDEKKPEAVTDQSLKQPVVDKELLEVYILLSKVPIHWFEPEVLESLSLCQSIDSSVVKHLHLHRNNQGQSLVAALMV